MQRLPTTAARNKLNAHKHMKIFISINVLAYFKSCEYEYCTPVNYSDVCLIIEFVLPSHALQTIERDKVFHISSKTTARMH